MTSNIEWALCLMYFLQLLLKEKITFYTFTRFPSANSHQIVISIWIVEGCTRLI